MGSYTSNNVYIPAREEINWDEGVNNNFLILSDLINSEKDIANKITALNNEIADVQTNSDDGDNTLSGRINSLQNDLTNTTNSLLQTINNLKQTIADIDTSECQHSVTSDKASVAEVANRVANPLTLNGTSYDGSASVTLNFATLDDTNGISSSLGNSISSLTDRINQLETAKFKITKVSVLPESGDSSTIYLVPKQIGGVSTNYYDEYIWTTDGFELIGDTEAKITNFYDKNETDSKYVPIAGDVTVDGVKKFSQNIVGNLTGNADTATKIKVPVAINNTAFDGSKDIITTRWGASRQITVQDYNAVNLTRTETDGSDNITLTLPSNIEFSNANIGKGVVNELESTTGTITNLKSSSISSSVIYGDSISAQTFNVQKEYVTNSTIENGTINTLNSTTGTITNLTSSKGSIDDFTSNISNINNLSANTITVASSLRSPNSNLTNISSDYINVRAIDNTTLNSNTANISTGNITTISGTNSYYNTYYGHYTYTVPADTSEYVFNVTMANNDAFRIKCGGSSDAGYASLEMHDNANDPIYVKQCSGATEYTITLMDAYHNTTFCGTVSAPKFIGYLQGDVGATNVSATTVSATNVNTTNSSITNLNASNVTINTKLTAPNFEGTFYGTLHGDVDATTVSATNVNTTNVSATNASLTDITASNVKVNTKLTAPTIEGGTFTGNVTTNLLKLNGHTITIVD